MKRLRGLITSFLFLSCLLFTGNAFAWPIYNGGIVEGDSPTFNNLSVTGNLNVSGNGPHNISSVQDDATGDEVGLIITGTCNKATSGDCTVVTINMIDTATPGEAIILDLKSGGGTRLSFEETGSGATITSPGVVNIIPGPSAFVAVPRFNINGWYTFTGGATSGTNYGSGQGICWGSTSTNIQTSGLVGDACFKRYSSGVIQTTDGSTGLSDIKTGGITVDRNLHVGGGVTFSGITSVSSTFIIPDNIRLVKGDVSGGVFTATLPDVTMLEEGQQFKIVKVDSSVNGITLDGFGSQTINGSLTKILRAPWQVITVEAAGSEWIITQATSIVTEGNMHIHDNTTNTVIYTADTPHYIFGLFSSVIELGLTFSAGFDGAIASFSDYSSTVPGAVLANDASHGLSTDQGITINNSADYNGAFNITVVDSNNFYFTDTFVGDETANWQKGDCMRVDPGSNGPLGITIAGFGLGTTGGTDAFEWEIYQQTPGSDPVPIENAEVKETFTGSTNPTSFTGIGSLSVGDGDEVCIAMIGLTGTDDFENTHISLIIEN